MKDHDIAEIQATIDRLKRRGEYDAFASREVSVEMEWWGSVLLGGELDPSVVDAIRTNAQQTEVEVKDSDLREQVRQAQRRVRNHSTD